MHKRFALLSLLALASITPACAQSAGDMMGTPQATASSAPSAQTLADAQRVAAYVLPETFFTHAADTLNALQAANIQPPNTRGASLNDVIDRTAQVPQLPTLLQSHGFTVESFILGMSAFNMTIAASQHHLPPNIPQPAAQNLTAIQNHPIQTSAIMQAMNGMQH
ncbi:hypothetical protein [Neokomagataea tanensis]|nr:MULTISPECIES: hypothetical protein [Neokomagataea]